MLGVLLQRQKAAVEIANDIDKRIIGWWATLRDQPTELAQLLACTPYSRAEYQHQLTQLEHNDPLQQALAVSVVLEQGLRGALDADPSSWRRNLAAKPSARSEVWAKVPERLLPVAKRIKTVQFECRPAVDLIDRLAGDPEVLLYLDPPYPSAPAAKHYTHTPLSDVVELVATAKAKVAVSGYNNEWDQLDFNRTEFECHSTALGNLTETTRPKRTEVLWTNFKPAQSTLFELSA